MAARTADQSSVSARAIAPGPAGHPLFGNLSALREGPLPLLMASAQRYGGVVRLRFGMQVVHLVTQPEHIKYVLQDNQKNYSKQTRGFKALSLFLGLGLLTSEGDTWLRQRRIAQPAFHRQRIAGFGAVMVRSAADMAEAWRGAAGSGRVVDMGAEMMRLTLRIAGETLLSTDPSGAADSVGEALTLLLTEARQRIYRPLMLPLGVPTPKNRRVKAAMRLLDSIVYTLIDERRRSANRPEDLLSMLLDARDEVTGEGMSDTQLRDEVMTMFLAGHETTANALTWTWYLLSLFPEAGRKLRAELAEVLNGRAPSVDDIPRLKYTSMVIEESMRLYPPAWMMTRAAREEDAIGGYLIPKGSFVALSPYITHRLPSLWENPEGFDPSRFTAERASAMPRFAYFPFGGGPRQCIGNTFAMMEAVLVLATLAQRFRADLVSGQEVKAETLITLRPQGGIRMTLHGVE